MCGTLGVTKILGPMAIVHAVRKLGKDQRRSAFCDVLDALCRSLQCFTIATRKFVIPDCYFQMLIRKFTIRDGANIHNLRIVRQLNNANIRTALVFINPSI